MKSLICSLLFMLMSMSIQAQVRHQEVMKMISDSLSRDTSLSLYDRKVLRQYMRWSKLIPSQSIIQTAGNMGAFSLGLGWYYGKQEQWETHVLFGFIPKHDSKNAKLTMNLKETYRPWSVKAYKDLYFEPLTCGIYFNIVFGQEFWGRQPERYPQSYYDFLSTKIRYNVFVGEQFTWKIPKYRMTNKKSVSLFYEVSTCDLYLRSMITEKYVKIQDILGISIGAKFSFI